MAVENEEFGDEEGCHTFVLGGAEVDRMAIRVGGRRGLGRYPGAGQPLFHLVEGDLSHVRALLRVEGFPDGRPVLQVGWGAAFGGKGGPWQRICEAEPRGAARP